MWKRVIPVTILLSVLAVFLSGCSTPVAMSWQPNGTPNEAYYYEQYGYEMNPWVDVRETPPAQNPIEAPFSW